MNQTSRVGSKSVKRAANRIPPLRGLSSGFERSLVLEEENGCAPISVARSASPPMPRVRAQYQAEKDAKLAYSRRLGNGRRHTTSVFQNYSLEIRLEFVKEVSGSRY